MNIYFDVVYLGSLKVLVVLVDLLLHLEVPMDQEDPVFPLLQDGQEIPDIQVDQVLL